MYVFQRNVCSSSTQAFYRLHWTGDILSSQLTHVPPGHAPITAESNFIRPLGVPALPHQHSELTYEWPGLSLLRHQLAYGASFNGISWSGLRPEYQPSVELAHELCQQLRGY